MAHVKGHKDIYKGRKIPPRKITWREIAAKFSGGPEGKDRREQFQSYIFVIELELEIQVNNLLPKQDRFVVLKQLKCLLY